jgi:hypothetical protein
MMPVLIVAALALLGALLSDGSARAEDYSMDFGAETPAGRDAGTVACVFGETCAGNMDTLGLSVNVYVFRSEVDRASVHLYGRRYLRLFYFNYAADSVAIDTRKPVSRVPFFKGERARGGLYIENERVGTLYLRFHFH